MSRPVGIRNVTTVEQYVLVDGRRYSVGPLQIRVMEEPIARAFLERCAPRIVREGGVGSVDEDHPREARVYLYNLSGNPDAPAEIQASVFENGKTITKMVPNPLREGVTCIRSLNGGEIIVTHKGETTARRLPPRKVFVHPWTRKAFEHIEEANWMMNREGMRHKTVQMLAYSRPSTNFEPNESWTLDDICLYASIIDLKCKCVPSEEILRMKAEKPNARNTLVEWFGEAGRNVRSGDEVVDMAKDLMLRRLYFRVANPLYNLLTREDFESQKAKIVDTKSEFKPVAKVGTVHGEASP